MNKFLYLLPVLSVLVLAAARFLEVGTKRKGVVRGPVRERLTFQLFVLIGLLVTFGSITEYLMLHRPFSWVLLAIGWVLGAVSFWVRHSAISALGKFWSLHVEIRDNHEFVTSGPFRVVRHPVYFSMILELLACVTFCGAWITAILIPIFFIPAMLRRVSLEEAAMIEKFGDRYRDYQKSTPAIFPRPW